MKISNEIIERVNNIQWFQNCGQKIEKDTKFNILHLDTWENTKKYYSSWGNVTLEARNIMTSFLNKNCKDQYLMWNKYTSEARAFIEDSIVPKIVKSVDVEVLNCVKWDILNAIMEYSYLKCNKFPIFFLELLQVYEFGNFPCGWEGKWPEGDLVVF